MDGCSIAYATLHYLLQNIKCFTLFVTHYWLLTFLESEWKGTVGNYHMSFFEEEPDEETQHTYIPFLSMTHIRITFLYKMERGPAKRSYGLNVALLAGIPDRVIQKASKISKRIEENNLMESNE